MDINKNKLTDGILLSNESIPTAVRCVERTKYLEALDPDRNLDDNQLLSGVWLPIQD